MEGRRMLRVVVVLAMLASIATAFAQPATQMVVSTCTVDAEKSGKSAMDKYFMDKFNVKYEFIPVTWGDWMEKARLWIAADEMPDVLWMDVKIEGTGEFKNWAASGAFKALPDDLSPWPNLKAWYDKMTSAKAMFTVNGKLYGWPATRNNPDWVKNTYQGVATYRRDWAKAVGLYKEGDVYTWAEAKALMKAVMEKDPGKNGKGQTIPLTFESWAFPGTLMEALAYQDQRDPYVKGKDGKWMPVWATEDYKNEVKFAVDLFRSGYIWKDQTLVKGSEGSDKFRAGQVFMHWGNSNGGWITDCYDVMKKNGVIKDIGDIAPMMILSPKDNKTFWLTETEDYWSVSCFSHKVDDAKMRRILDMWDWLQSPEGNVFRAFGVPGKDFTVNKDGSRTLLWPRNERGDPVDPYSDAKVAKFYLRQPGWYGSFPETSRKDTDVLFSKLMDMQAYNPNFRIHKMNWAIRTFDGKNFKKVGNYSQDVKDRILLLCGNKEDVGKAWDDFVKEYLPKVKPVLDELNASLK